MAHEVGIEWRTAAAPVELNWAVYMGLVCVCAHLAGQLLSTCCTPSQHAWVLCPLLPHAANSVWVRPPAGKWPLFCLRCERLQFCEELYEVLRWLCQNPWVCRIQVLIVGKVTHSKVKWMWSPDQYVGEVCRWFIWEHLFSRWKLGSGRNELIIFSLWSSCLHWH